MSIHQLPPVPALLAQMEQFARDVRQAVENAGSLDWQASPTPSAWNLTQVCCHLRDVEQEVHQARFRQLLASENAFLSGADPDKWAEARQYHLQDGPTSMQQFLTARQQTLELLNTIQDPTLWQRQGRHAFFGSTSIHELLHIIVKHDAVHLEQIGDLLA